MQTESIPTLCSFRQDLQLICGCSSILGKCKILHKWNSAKFVFALSHFWIQTTASKKCQAVVCYNYLFTAK